LFGLLESAFFAANLLKIAHGGWFPLVVAVTLFAIMTTWKSGRRLVWERLQKSSMPRDVFFESLQRDAPQRVPGTAVYMAGSPEGTPIALLHNLAHNKVLHERNILLTVVTEDVPHVRAEERSQVEQLPVGFQRVVGHYGFMEEPNVPDLLRKCRLSGPPLDMQKTTFFMSRETILPSGSKPIRRWRKWLFALLARNAQSATVFFKLPPNRVVELGMQVEI
jgi:KUP system potassium uptake protein